ncbi:hypothetical protein SD71_03110 [Cohnella kolymensis]|uniref:Sigma-70 family RNA polymerase sigma factor n=1 Tax=Cohnella kolymensis TaxID=1590652 RepID=A0ABR5AAA9_9BACL|nr:hypothetical protein [Cohnella kolymensis]KIL37608.1 hypothetical protein SD71_03110 [Cohnella kolymensis]
MAQLIRQIWKVDPSSFITIWKHDQLIASVGKIPLHDTMLHVLACEPLLQPFVSAWKPVPMAFLLSFIGIDPELEDKTRAYIIHTLINHFSPSEWILDFTCLREWFPVFELCGFERAPWADATTSLGTEYRAFVLDLTKEDFLTKLDRSLTKGQAEQTVDQNQSCSNLQELKKVLNHWNELPRDPAWSEAYTRLFPNRRTLAGSSEWTGQDVREDVSGAIQNLMQGEEREAILGKLLMYTYIQGIRPHDRVAERLGLSAASYYRHLNKALELLCRCLSHAN